MADERERREGRDGDPGAGIGAPAWAGGVTLVLVGLLFLLQNLGLLRLPDNWWALFILIPAVSLAATAVARYRAAGGRLTPAARGALTAAVSMTVIALMFLLNLNWGVWWPVFVILAGVIALLNRSTLTEGARQRER